MTTKDFSVSLTPYRNAKQLISARQMHAVRMFMGYLRKTRKFVYLTNSASFKGLQGKAVSLIKCASNRCSHEGQCHSLIVSSKLN